MPESVYTNLASISLYYFVQFLQADTTGIKLSAKTHWLFYDDLTGM
jgi:hypothetical protein